MKDQYLTLLNAIFFHWIGSLGWSLQCLQTFLKDVAKSATSQEAVFIGFHLTVHFLWWHSFSTKTQWSFKMCNIQCAWLAAFTFCTNGIRLLTFTNLQFKQFFLAYGWYKFWIFNMHNMLIFHLILFAVHILICHVRGWNT